MLKLDNKDIIQLFYKGFSMLTIRQINRYERGKTVPREATLVALADAFEIDPDSLYEDSEG